MPAEIQPEGLPSSEFDWRKVGEFRYDLPGG